METVGEYFIYLFSKKKEPRVYFKVELSSAVAGVPGVEPRRRGCCRLLLRLTVFGGRPGLLVERWTQEPKVEGSDPGDWPTDRAYEPSCSAFRPQKSIRCSIWELGII